jgi:DNA primase
MRYGEGLMEEIRRRTDLVALVGRRVKLVRKGRVMWGCCPFHGEKSPSFKVENERRAYKCFGCGAGGDAFKWLMETEGLSFPEAVERLAAEAGVALPKWSPEDEARESKRKSLYEIVELAAAFYEARLREGAGRPARDYLKARGLDEAAAKQFRLGYAPDGNALVEYLKSRTISVDDMIAAGLARPDADGRPLRDFFYKRVLFPITDPRGRVIAFGGRALEADAKPKYINTGETVLFSKGAQLYNFAAARAAAIKAQRIVVAEGYMDVIALVRAGFAEAVAPLGTALTEDQLALLWRTAPEPVLAFDGDQAGLTAAHRAARLALPLLKPGYSLRFIFLPLGEDPDSFLSAHGAAAMGKLLDACEPLSEVVWRVATEGKDFSTPERRAGLERALGETVSTIQDSKIADYYRRDFETRIFESFKRRTARPLGGRPYRGTASTGKGGRFREPARPLGVMEGQNVSPAVKASLLARQGKAGALQVKEMELCALLLETPAIALHHGELLAALPLGEPQLDRLRHELLNLAASGSSLEKAGLENHLLRQGMAELAARLAVRCPVPDGSFRADNDQPVQDHEARFLRVAADLREMAQIAPERARAFERFKRDASAENEREAYRLLGPKS